MKLMSLTLCFSLISTSGMAQLSNSTNAANPTNATNSENEAALKRIASEMEALARMAPPPPDYETRWADLERQHQELSKVTKSYSLPFVATDFTKAASTKNLVDGRFEIKYAD